MSSPAGQLGQAAVTSVIAWPLISFKRRGEGEEKESRRRGEVEEKEINSPEPGGDIEEKSKLTDGLR